MTTIDNSDEVERARRKAYIERIRKENDEAPRPTVSAITKAKQRAGLLEPNDEEHHFCGIAPADMTALTRQGVIDEGRRNASAESTKTGGDGLVFKTRAPNRELSNERQPAEEDFGIAEAPQPTVGADPWADWNSWADAKIAAALAGRHEDVVALAHATREFAETVEQRMIKMETLCNQLQATLELMRARYDSQPIDLPNPLHKSRVN